MKIQYINSLKQGKGINVLYHIKDKKCNKFFKWNQFKDCCNFAITIEDDRYMDSFPNALRLWAIENGHPIIQKKYVDFC